MSVRPWPRKDSRPEHPRHNSGRAPTKRAAAHTCDKPAESRIAGWSLVRPSPTPMKSESVFLNTRHDTESGDTNAASPAGSKKSMEDRSPGSNSARVAASNLLCNGQGRTTGVITVTKPPQPLPERLLRLSFAMLEH